MGYNRQQIFMRKKLLTLLIAVVSLTSNVTNIFCMDYWETIGGIRYRISTYPTSTATVVSTNISVGDIIIPSYITYQKSKYYVKSVDMTAFAGLTMISSISVPNTVLEIGMDAFQSVLNVLYYGSATGSPWGAKCHNGYVDYPFAYSDTTKTNLIACAASVSGEIIIPDCVQIIQKNAFEGCTDISRIIILNCKTSIDNSILQNFDVVINGNSYVTLPDTILCHRGTQICDELGNNCQSFYQSGIFTQTYTNVNGCDSIVTRNVILRQDTTYLPDTTVCYGGWVFDGEPLLLYNYLDSDDAPCNWNKDEWMRLGYDPSPKNEYGEYDDTLFELFMSWFYEHIHYDATTLPTGVTTYQTNITNGQQFYTSGVYTRTFINSKGCDSIVSRNVIVSKAAAPKIIATPEQDTFNSGKIKIYNKYCTGSEYYKGQYNYYYKNAYYDYFTVNGTKYDFPSAIEGEYNEYYHPDGIRVIDEPSTVIDNLPGGSYRIVFYSACDSVVEYVTIESYGIEVDGIYYLLNENNHTATLTYRGSSYDSYSGEYSGNITIPKTITFDGIEYQVTGINSSTFSGCSNISTITMESETPISMYSSGLSNNCIIYVPYGSLNAYKSASGWRNYTIHVINPSHATTTIGATSATITLGNTNEAQHIASCGMEGGAEEFAGNVIEYIGLEPNSEYAKIPLFIKTKEGDLDNTTISFRTTALELTTKASKPVSSTTAILLAETNMSDAEVSCGFEYKRNDAPADMEETKVFCPVASGQMAGRLKNLKDDVYYKYRAFYQSAAGNMYYGDWQYIFTGDVAVEFDPILYTYGATVVRENEATISGYALAGSEDFTEQGFEYWAERRADGGANAPHRMPAALGEHFFVQASGISLRVTLNNLDAGTVYKYRVYGKVGDQYYYGSEQSFTTTGTYTPSTYTITFANWDGAVLQSSQVEEGTLPEYTGTTPIRPDDEQYTYVFNGWTPAIVVATADATYTATYQSEPKSLGIEDVQGGDVQCTKVLRNGMIYILRGERVYTITGTEVK